MASREALKARPSPRLTAARSVGVSALVLLVTGCATGRASTETGHWGEGASAPARGSAPEPGAESGRAPPFSAPFGGIVLGGDLAALHAGKPVRFLVHTQDAERLIGRYASVHPEARQVEGGVMMATGELPREIVERHLTATFLVDFDQPAITELASSLAPGFDVETLRDHVAKHLEHPTHGTFWTASRAAKLKAGDCTEHAVVVAAVARAKGAPARVVLGYVMFTDGERGMAIGHAWAEVHDGARWTRVDATPIGAEQFAYITLGELSDEGTSFNMSMLPILSILEVPRIDIVAIAAD